MNHSAPDTDGQTAHTKGQFRIPNIPSRHVVGLGVPGESPHMNEENKHHTEKGPAWNSNQDLLTVSTVLASTPPCSPSVFKDAKTAIFFSNQGSQSLSAGMHEDSSSLLRGAFYLNCDARWKLCVQWKVHDHNEKNSIQT